MSVESAYERLRKVIVEGYVADCSNAQAAIRLGNTMEMNVKERMKQSVKFQQFIAGKDTKMAITERYPGLTVLKVCFLDVPGQAAAKFIEDEIYMAVKRHNEYYKDNLEVKQIDIRAKPQPQVLELNIVPKTAKILGF